MEREEFRGVLIAYRNLYAFLSQIIPYQDSDLEKLYTFVRNLIAKLPPADDGGPFVLEDEVSLRYYRMQQITDGSINLGQGDNYPLKGPTDVGTAAVADLPVALSSLVNKLNERFGTDFTEADQLFFDQIRVSAEASETIQEAARANNLTDFTAYLERVLDELFIERMDGNEEIFSRVMTDRQFRSAAGEHLAFEIFERLRSAEPKDV
jgi:type I restriction enzyme R subunit